MSMDFDDKSKGMYAQGREEKGTGMHKGEGRKGQDMAFSRSRYNALFWVTKPG